MLVKSHLSACNFSCFISTVIWKDSIWRPSLCWGPEVVRWKHSLFGGLRAAGNGLLAIQRQPWNRELWWGTAGACETWNKRWSGPSIYSIRFGRFHKNAHIHLENLVWNHLYICQSEVFPQWKYLLRKKKKSQKYLFQCIPFLRHVLNVVSVVFGPQRLAHSHWVAQFQDWVHSGSKSWFCKSDHPIAFVHTKTFFPPWIQNSSLYTTCWNHGGFVHSFTKKLGFLSFVCLSSQV